MKIESRLIPLVIVNVLVMLFFGTSYILKKNYEFMVYVGVIVFFILLIIYAHKRIDFPMIVYWGLTLWSFLHMSGGWFYFNGTRLYDIILVPIVGAPYHILRYDQFVHVIGFCVATLAMFYLIKPLIKDFNRWAALSIVVVMAGLGVGALNEIIEFIAAVIISVTGVGGYENTSLDLVADLVGALVALIIIRFREK